MFLSSLTSGSKHFDADLQELAGNHLASTTVLASGYRQETRSCLLDSDALDRAC